MLDQHLGCLATVSKGRSLASSPIPDRMPSVAKLVFLVGPLAELIQSTQQLLTQLKCAVEVVPDTESMATLARSATPCLVIVADNQPPRIEQTVQVLHQMLDPQQVTIVTLSDRYGSPTALPPSMALVDGHLVSPIDRSVLGSLVHSASLRQFCHRAWMAR